MSHDTGGWLALCRWEVLREAQILVSLAEEPGLLLGRYLGCSGGERLMSSERWVRPEQEGYTTW